MAGFGSWRTARAAETSEDRLLWHVLLVGGTVADWDAIDDAGWEAMLDDLGTVADGVGARWLSFRPLDAAAVDGSGSVTGRAIRHRVVGGCTVIADPEVDGRARFLAAVERLRLAGTEISEVALDDVLDAPAEASPDLAVVLGPPERWPRSLMWELAYSELVYLDVAWDELRPQHLADAIAAYAGRHRRFGGVD